MVQFLSINFFSWISSIFVGFFKSSHFFCVTLYNGHLSCLGISRMIMGQAVLCKLYMGESRVMWIMMLVDTASSTILLKICMYLGLDSWCCHLSRQFCYSPRLSMLIIYYNKPTRCSCSQSILFYRRVTIHVSGAFHTHHQEYIKLYL